MGVELAGRDLMRAVALLATAEAVGRYHPWLPSANEQDIVPVALSLWAEYASQCAAIEFTRREMDHLLLRTMDQLVHFVTFVDEFLRDHFAPRRCTEIYPTSPVFF